MTGEERCEAMNISLIIGEMCEASAKQLKIMRSECEEYTWPGARLVVIYFSSYFTNVALRGKRCDGQIKSAPSIHKAFSHKDASNLLHCPRIIFFLGFTEVLFDGAVDGQPSNLCRSC